MSIRSKLLVLILTVSLGFILSIGLYFFMTNPMQKISAEQETLDTLQYTLLQFRSHANRLDSFIIAQQLPVIEQLKENIDTRFAAVQEVAVLPEIGEDVRESLEIISNIQELLNSSYDELMLSVETLMEYGESIFFFTDQLRLSDFYTSRKVLEHELLPDVQLELDEFNTALYGLDMNIETSVNEMENQKERINGTIQTIQQRGFIIVMVISLLMLCSAIAFALRLAGKIAGNIHGIEQGIALMKGGDLTVRFHSTSKDDLGRLSRNLNTLRETLIESLGEIQKSSRENLAAGENLHAAVQETTASTEEMQSNSGSIRERLRQLDGNVQRSSGALDSVSENLLSLQDSVEEQTTMVEESSASVTQMITSLGSIAEITRKRQAAARRLVAIAQQGSDQLDLTNRIISEVTESIDGISETANIIKGIASQTNLLAMNAAIEAAHAGDSGRGFAVVADEIRKLAEESSSQSKRISSILKEVIGKIQGVASAGEGTRNVFSEMNREVQETSSSFHEISDSMAELQSGSQQILSAMTALREVAAKVQSGEQSMSEASGSAREAMDNLKHLSAEVLGSIDEIAVGIGRINDAMQSVSGISGTVGRIAASLDQSVEVFTIHTPDAGEDDPVEPGQDVNILEPDAQAEAAEENSAAACEGAGPAGEEAVPAESGAVR